MERFFNEVVEALKSNAKLMAVLKETATEKDCFEIKKTHPRMTVLNRVLTHETLRHAVWAEFGLERDVPLPKLDEEDLLYGSLSNGVHDPGLRNVYVPKTSPTQFKSFVAAICRRLNKDVVEYDPDKALVGSKFF